MEDGDHERRHQRCVSQEREWPTFALNAATLMIFVSSSHCTASSLMMAESHRAASIAPFAFYHRSPLEKAGNS